MPSWCFVRSIFRQLIKDLRAVGMAALRVVARRLVPHRSSLSAGGAGPVMERSALGGLKVAETAMRRT